MTLRDLPVGKTATIRSVGGEGALRQHFLDMGLIPQGEVTVVKYAPMGDPVELRIHSYELTLRLADAEKIEIENIRDAGQVKPEKMIVLCTQVAHEGRILGRKHCCIQGCFIAASVWHVFVFLAVQNFFICRNLTRSCPCSSTIF